MGMRGKELEEARAILGEAWSHDPLCYARQTDATTFSITVNKM